MLLANRKLPDVPVSFREFTSFSMYWPAAPYRDSGSSFQSPPRRLDDNCPRLRLPPIQAPVLNRLPHMRHPYVIRAGQVGNGPGNLEHPVVGPGRK